MPRTATRTPRTEGTRTFTRITEPESYEVTAAEIMKLAVIEGAMGALDIDPDTAARSFEVINLESDSGVLLGFNFSDDAVARYFIGKNGARLGQPLSCRTCKKECSHYGGFKGIARMLGHVLVGKDDDGAYTTTRVSLVVLNTPEKPNNAVIVDDTTAA